MLGEGSLPPMARESGKTNRKRMHFLMNFGCTDLLIGHSQAKNSKESAGDVRIGVAAQKPDKNMQKNARNFGTKNFSKSKQEMSGMARNAFPQSFDANAADFKG